MNFSVEKARVASAAPFLLSLGHQQGSQNESCGADAGKAQEGDAVAEPVAHPSSQRRTQRSSDPNSAAHDPLRLYQIPPKSGSCPECGLAEI